MFAGLRRLGDAQYFLECIVAPSHYLLYMMSLDIAIDQQWGNVLDAKSADFWRALIRERAILGILAAPPYETWTVARMDAMLDNLTLSPHV